MDTRARLIAVAAVFAVLAGARPALADAISEPDKAGGGFVRMRVGRAVAPFSSQALSRVESEFTSARLTVVGGFVRLRPDIAVAIRVPMAPSSVKQPAGSYVDEKAFGNVELSMELERELPWPVDDKRLWIRLAAGLPTAGLGAREELTEGQVLALSDALDGWRQPELYTPGVAAVTATAGIDLWWSSWQISTQAKAPLLLRISDGPLPDDARTRPIGFAPHLDVRALRWHRQTVGLGLGLFAAAQAPAAVVPAADTTPIQLGIEPTTHWAFGAGVEMVVDASILLGGPLAGTWGFGLAVRVDP